MVLLPNRLKYNLVLEMATLYETVKGDWVVIKDNKHLLIRFESGGPKAEFISEQRAFELVRNK